MDKLFLGIDGIGGSEYPLTPWAQAVQSTGSQYIYVPTSERFDYNGSWGFGMRKDCLTDAIMAADSKVHVIARSAAALAVMELASHPQMQDRIAPGLSWFRRHPRMGSQGSH